jgi:pimeloyl-ACP methyl ester carboxylesterase
VTQEAPRGLLRRWIRRVWCVAALLCVAAAAGAAYERAHSQRDHDSVAPGRLVDIGGHRLHLWCLGTGAPVVVLEAGSGGSSLDWYPVLQRASSFTTTCAYDRAGLGYSETGPSPRTSTRIADELTELLQRSGTEVPVVLVAWSSGGLHARMTATAHTSLVAGLVLVDASHEDQVAKFAEAGYSSDLPFYAGLVPPAAELGLLRLAGRLVVPPLDGWPVPVRPFVQATINRPGRYRALIEEERHFATSADNVRAQRRPLSMPLVVLTAGRTSTPEIWMPLQRDLLGLSPRSCHVVLESGHNIPDEAPEAVVRAIRSVIEAWRTLSGPDC